MTPTKAYEDTRLRKYALNNLRAVLQEMRAIDDRVVDKLGARQDRLSKAAKWATIAEALRPEPPVYHNEFRVEDES